jgi:hypothetical protein
MRDEGRGRRKVSKAPYIQYIDMWLSSAWPGDRTHAPAPAPHRVLPFFSSIAALPLF